MSRLPLLTLTLASFSIGTSEFAIQGLLPEISSDLGVTIPAAGLLVTGFALGVAIGGPIFTIAANGLSRRTAVLVLMVVFVIGSVLCALAPDYGLLMFARVVSSFTLGAFFGIGSVVVVGIVAEDRRASSLALFWAGIAAANIFGVPAGTALGHAFGWRSTFWAVTVLACFATVALFIWLPATGRSARTKLTSEFTVLAKPQVLIALGLAVLNCAAAFAVFTYIAPLLIEIVGVPAAQLPLYLLVFGVGGVVGMQLGGRLANKRTADTIVGSFVALVAVYLALLPASHGQLSAMVMMFVWGFAFYFPASAIQLQVMNAAADAPNLASTLVSSAFNVGNAIGPFVGAFVLTAGFGYDLLAVPAALLAVAGATLALWSATLDHPHSR